MSVSEELARLAQLRDQGVLTPEEFETQKAAVLRGDHPATPEAKAPGKGKRSLGIGCLVVFGIFVLLAIIGALSDEKKGSNATNAAPDEAAAAPVAVTAVQLFQAYQANEAAAQQQFGDQTLLVSATLDSVDLDMSDKPTLMLETPNQFMSAHAELTEKSQGEAASLRKGQSIKLLCKGVSEVMSIPMLKECEIQ